MLDFEKRLFEYINNLEIGHLASIGTLDEVESLTVNSLPGGAIKQGYYDGTADRLLPYEVRFKSKDNELASDLLVGLAHELESLESLKSSNGSFEFESISITSHPFINDQDEQNNYTYVFDIQAEITTFKKEGKNNG